MTRNEMLDGFLETLELERELGTRVFSCDRSLLTALPSQPPPAVRSSPPAETASSPSEIAASPAQETSTETFDFVFLSDRPLSPRAVEMMAKITQALGKTAETAPIVTAPPVPKAKAYVMLGAKALQTYASGAHPAENTWFKSSGGKDVLYVRSPEDIVRFRTETPAIRQIKLAMWQALKGVRQRTMQ